MKNLAKAIIEVMKDVKGVEKSMTVGSGNYSYQGVSDYEVKKIYNKSMAENGLCILPIEVNDTTDINRWEESNQYGIKQKLSVFTKVKVKYLLLHTSGESQEIAGYGHGIDSGDKGAGKATTYALKYALLYTFLTPTGKIDDSDNTHSDDIAKPKKKDKLTNEGLKYLREHGTIQDLNKALKERELSKVQLEVINDLIKKKS